MIFSLYINIKENINNIMSKKIVSYDFDGVIHTDVWLDQRGQYHPNTFTNYRKWMDNINYKIVRQIKKDYKKYDLVILTARSKKYYKYSYFSWYKIR